MFSLFAISFSLGYLLSATSAVSQPAGILTTISESVIENEVNGLFEDLESEIVGKDFGGFQRYYGDIKWGLEHITLYDFTGPATDLDFSAPGSGTGARLTAQLSGAVLKARFKWWVRYNTWIYNFYFDGYADARLQSVDITKVVDIDTGNGKLKMEPCGTCCKLDIGSITIGISGNPVSWIIEKVINWFEWVVEDTIREETCAALKDVVQNDVNEFLADIETEKSLTDSLVIDYSPVHVKPVSDCLELGLAGVVSSTDSDIQLSPIQGIRIGSECMNHDTNFKFKISDKSIQTLFESMYKSGKLYYSVDQNEILDAADIFQPGHFARNADELLQHSILKILVNTTDVPSVHINATGLRVMFPLELKLTLHHPNTAKSNKLVLTTAAQVNLGLKAALNRTDQDIRISGHISETSINVMKVDSTREEYTAESVQDFLSFILKTLLQPLANQHLAEGAPISISNHFLLHSSTLLFKQGYMEIQGMIDEW